MPSFLNLDFDIHLTFGPALAGLEFEKGVPFEHPCSLDTPLYHL